MSVMRGFPLLLDLIQWVVTVLGYLFSWYSYHNFLHVSMCVKNNITTKPN